MKHPLYLLTLSTFLTSCATILNQSHKNITIYTTEPSKIIYQQDTIQTSDNKAHLRVERQKEVLRLVAATDSVTKTVEVEPNNSFMYWMNLFYNYGIGMLVDSKNPKRYAYPSSIYIRSDDTTSRYFRYGPANHKGELYLQLSLPYINSFHLTPENEGTKVNTGFWGVSLGLDYYHSNTQFVNVGISGVLKIFLPVPAPVELSGEHEFIRSSYLSLSNNHRLKRFTLGYGLAYARNTWELKYFDRFDPPPPTREPVKKSNHALGFVFPIYFQSGAHFNMGVVYRPTFYRPYLNNPFVYEHLVSIDFAWKIRLKK